MSQSALAEAVHLERTAITRLEKGERKLSAAELVDVARVLDLSLQFFVGEAVPEVISRRSDGRPHDTSSRLDATLGSLATDTSKLVETGLLVPPTSVRRRRTPKNHRAAEQAAHHFRDLLGLSDAPIADLGSVCARLGLFVFSDRLGESGPDGGCVEVNVGESTVGAAVVNGQAPAGRRRMTLAHELGHWLFGDAYDSEASTDGERMINSFAIYFLAPRTGVHGEWNAQPDRTDRDRALAVGATFRLSWSAVLGHLRNVDLISARQFEALRTDLPRPGDFARIGHRLSDELEPPYLSPEFEAACIDGYLRRQLTIERTTDLLRGTLAPDDLPRRAKLTLDDFRESFPAPRG